MLQGGSKDGPVMSVPATPDDTPGFVPGPWCQKRAAAVAEAEAEKAVTAAKRAPLQGVTYSRNSKRKRIGLGFIRAVFP